jgi:hypothetical protein
MKYVENKKTQFDSELISARNCPLLSCYVKKSSMSIFSLVYCGCREMSFTHYYRASQTLSTSIGLNLNSEKDLKDKIHKYENGMILNFTKNRQNMVSEVNI